MLAKFDNYGDATTVYVTDYTPSSLVYPMKATWCLPQLYGRVLQCEMWDDARMIVHMMKPGNYWYLNNVQAKWNPRHYMEGTMKLTEKVEHLNINQLEAYPHFRKLLARVSCNVLL